MHHEVVRIRGKGRGVVATKTIQEGQTIEVCPVLLFKQKTSNHMLQEYCFRWDKETVALALGWGSLYNHSYTPNAVCDPDKRRKAVVITALTKIEKGTEITFNYNGAPDDMSKLWFDTK